MKSFLRAGAAGLCLLLPGISLASTLNFECAGSQYTLLFDPRGCNPSQLPKGNFYRSYDCRIGDKYQPVIIFTPVVKTPPIVNDPPKDSTLPKPNDPPQGNDPVNPVVPILPPACPASVPLPAPSEMAGAGLAATALLSWIRARRQVRA